ncbi:transposase [uncultured Pantoea sp.]|uniref:RNA-guided endonuclease InsQ/TnpB family protein n=1 Tax=uncultured Pantoea sp. TaxID=218084 RepID=UPI0025D7EB3D|nr:transposase [uncultured Pantoea sp.]
MIRRQAYKFQLKPTPEQIASMKSFAGACRFVYNRALTMQSDIWRNGDRYIPYNKMAPWLVEWKSQEEMSWLSNAPSQILQQSLKDLDKAFNNLFARRATFPSPKKKGKNDAFRYPTQRVKLDEGNERIQLPKLGWVRYRKSRSITGVVKNVTVSMKLDKWYVSLQTEAEVDEPSSQQSSMIGLDTSNIECITTSDSTDFLSQASLPKMEKSLEKNIKRLRKKKRFSSNWVKQRHKVNRLLNRISNMRKDHFHKISTTLSKNHAIVVIENLEAATSLSRRPKSTKRFLSNETYELKRQLDYKLIWNGGELVTVRERDNNFKPVSDDASSSHYGKLRAERILAAGHAVIACGGAELLGHPMKQEPSEDGKSTANLL